MVTSVCPNNTSTDDLSSDRTWIELYPKLLSLSRHFVYRYWIPCWCGQEEDIANDVAQETARRVIERSQKATRGEAAPIGSIENMMMVIALNYVRDLRRHDYRVIRIPSGGQAGEMRTDMNDLSSMTELATEDTFNEWLFLRLAREIANFPNKQRQALLTDLANLMQFDEQPTSLQKAFLEVGIQLQEYQRPLPDNPVERARHTSLLCYAYKRIAQLHCVQEDASAA